MTFNRYCLLARTHGQTWADYVASAFGITLAQRQLWARQASRIGA